MADRALLHDIVGAFTLSQDGQRVAVQIRIKVSPEWNPSQIGRRGEAASLAESVNKQSLLDFV
jgi:hypothetical protein